MRTLRGLLAVALLALAWPVQAAEVDKYLPDDTEVVALLNVQQVLDAPLVKKHFLQAVREHLKSNAEVTKVFESLGFDPFKDLTSITGAVATLGNDAKGLIIAHGHFDKAKFEARAADESKGGSGVLKTHQEGNHKIYEVKVEGGQEKPLFVGVLDQATIVAGPDKQYILDAFAKAEGKKKGMVKKELQELIEKTDAKQSLWLIMTANALLKSEIANEEKAKKNLEKINNITIGVTVEKGIKAGLAIATKSPDNAKELAKEIEEGLGQAKGLLALIAEQKKELAPAVDVINGLKVGTEGSTITLKTEVSEETLEKGLKKQ